ncbi:MAG: AI-2E family transporter, partial [Halioglobus sp.]|nr:AI-2E family transporter [Halioglobus sp.]
MMPEKKLGANRIVLLAFLCIALYACYVLVKPFLEPILLAIIVGMLAYPVHARVVTAMRGRQSLAALFSCLAVMMIILLPTLALLAAVLDQGITYTIAVKEWATPDNMRNFMARPWVASVYAWLVDVLPEGALELENIRTRALSLASTMGGKFAATSTVMLGSVTNFILMFVLLLFVLFFVLRDHERLIEFLRHALPLSRSQED